MEGMQMGKTPFNSFSSIQSDWLVRLNSRDSRENTNKSNFLECTRANASYAT